MFDVRLLLFAMLLGLTTTVIAYYDDYEEYSKFADKYATEGKFETERPKLDWKSFAKIFKNSYWKWKFFGWLVEFLTLLKNNITFIYV